MKLLLDENLSPTLVKTLAETYPETAHVREFDLQSAPDPEVWAYAVNHGYTIMTKDADFTIEACWTATLQDNLDSPRKLLHSAPACVGSR